jgi:hypothetical protein
MKDLAYDFLGIAKHNKDGSYATMGDRKDMLLLFARQLHELGWRELRAHDLKGRHINALLKLWKSQDLSSGTIRNRLAALRWLCRKLDRPAIMPKLNAAYDLEPRHTVADTSKAQVLTEEQISKIACPYVQWSVRLEQAFGLRRKEGLLIQMWDADEGDALYLHKTKGKVPRTIPIRTPEQRALLDALKAWLPSKQSSLIPPHLNYIQQRRRYDRLIREAGLHNLHGLRHAYSQRRFEEEAGFPSPLAGGPHSKDLTKDQRAVNRQARLTVSKELGHHRYSISSTYIGT